MIFSATDSILTGTPPTPFCSHFHVAIILDGNGRWAERQGKKRTWGHYKGAQALKRIVQSCPSQGISHLTVFAFSTENWKRPPEEVGYLMNLVASYLRAETDALYEKNVRLHIMGHRPGLPSFLLPLITHAEEKTKGNKGLQLYIALNYGGRHDIVSAAQHIAQEAQAGRLDPTTLTEDIFSGFLHTAPAPDPDLLIRTGGEMRISNYLLWQLSHSELIFLDVCWPDFTKAHLEEALAIYHTRTRTYGGSRGITS